jgi:pyridoxamine 5'-phosphate oxidase
MELNELRKEYRLKTLDASELSPDPLDQFDKWFKEAVNAHVDEPAAMQLATADSEGRPSCRTVLLRAYSKEGFLFLTNYGSRKAAELDRNPCMCVLFYWKEIERQVIIQGEAVRAPKEASEKAFASRPRNRQLGAWASRQSRPLDSRAALEKEFARLEKAYEGQPVPCPPFWGGYLIRPSRYEFWQGRESRLHDRFEYMLSDDAWKIQRLYP